MGGLNSTYLHCNACSQFNSPVIQPTTCPILCTATLTAYASLSPQSTDVVRSCRVICIVDTFVSWLATVAVFQGLVCSCSCVYVTNSSSQPVLSSNTVLHQWNSLTHINRTQGNLALQNSTTIEEEGSRAKGHVLFFVAIPQVNVSCFCCSFLQLRQPLLLAALSVLLEEGLHFC